MVKKPVGKLSPALVWLASGSHARFEADFLRVVLELKLPELALSWVGNCREFWVVPVLVLALLFADETVMQPEAEPGQVLEARQLLRERDESAQLDLQVQPVSRGC